MLKNIITRMCIALTSISLVGCSNDLSRENAESKIKEVYQYPKAESTTIAKSYVVKTWLVEQFTPGLCVKNPKYSLSSDMLNTLKDKQLITMSERTTTENKCNHTRVDVSLTSHGREYLINETNENYVLRTGEITIDEVTGIHTNNESKIAVAEYTLKIINSTPFAIKNTTAPSGGKVRFALYDDGWRISK